MHHLLDTYSILCQCNLHEYTGMYIIVITVGFGVKYNPIITIAINMINCNTFHG